MNKISSSNLCGPVAIPAILPHKLGLHVGLNGIMRCVKPGVTYGMPPYSLLRHMQPKL